MCISLPPTRKVGFLECVFFFYSFKYISLLCQKEKHNSVEMHQKCATLDHIMRQAVNKINWL